MAAHNYRMRAAIHGLIFIAIFLVSINRFNMARAESIAEKYFRPPMAGELMNPLGDLLLSLDRQGTVQRILVTDLETKLQREILTTDLFRGEKKAVTDMRWIDSRSLLVSVEQRGKGIADIANTRNTVKTLVFMLPDNIQRGTIDIREIKSKGFVAGTIPAAQHTILFARSGDISKIYRIDISLLSRMDEPVDKTTLVDGGQFIKSNEVASIDGLALRWFADGKGNIRAVTTVNSQKKFCLWYRTIEDASWSSIRTWTPKEGKMGQGDSDELNGLSSVLPQALGDEEKTFYITETDANEITALYKYNYQNDSKLPIYQQSSGEIIHLQFDYTGNQLLAVVLRHGSEIYYNYLDNQSREIQEKLRKRLTTNIVITGINLDHRYFSVLASDAEHYGMLYRYDSNTDKLSPIHSVAPWLDGIKMGRVESGKVESDNLDIEFLLTRPTAKSKAPLVVIPHGGPIGIGDDRNFDPVVQYLVAQGFAVLKVNYRGSSGYGAEFIKAGKKEFGNKILGDIDAAVNRVVAQELVDPKARCIIGGSYGGYAALMLAIRHPAEYRCVASLDGVTDVSLLFDRALNSGTKKFLIDYIGDPITDYEYFKSISPVYLIGALRSPLYLAQGDEDTRVDPEHAYRLKSMLDLYGMNYQWEILKGEAHGFDNYMSAAAYYEKLGNFLHNNLQ